MASVTIPNLNEPGHINSFPLALPPPPASTRHSPPSQAQSITSSLNNKKTTDDRHQVEATTLAASIKATPSEAIQVSAQSISTDALPNPLSPPAFTSVDDFLAFMSFDFGLSLEQEPVDWDQFFTDADLKQQDPLQELLFSPAPSDSQTATPKSTESEQSQALDIIDPEPVFDFDLDFDLSQIGIIHKQEDMDIFNSLPAYELGSGNQPDDSLVSDPTMTSTFGPSFQGFGDFTGLGDNAATQLGLTNLLGKFGSPESSPDAPADSSNSLSQAYLKLGWAPSTVTPSALTTSPRPALKRKNSDASADSSNAQSKRPRGRPPKSRAGDVPPPSAKRPYRRQSKGEDTPVMRNVSFADDDADSEPDSPKLTASGKPSTARPKSVVPEKYLKDGSAQTILGMTIDVIQAFPTFEELLKKVEPAKREAAAEFGYRIAENRDKAKDAAKKSREERKAKIDTLERTVSDLEGKIEGLQGILLTLVARGVLSEAEVAQHLS